MKRSALATHRASRLGAARRCGIECNGYVWGVPTTGDGTVARMFPTRPARHLRRAST